MRAASLLGATECPNTNSRSASTPPEYFKAIGLTFDLDPCSPGPGHWVPALKIYTAADDGLRQPWPPNDRVFMNPPFGGRRGHVPWLRKFFAHPGGGIALVAARTSADWFHEVVVPNAELLCFPNGKTKFHRPDGSIGREPGTGVVLAWVASHVRRCCAANSAPATCPRGSADHAHPRHPSRY